MQDTLQELWKILIEYWILVWMIVASTAMAMLRTAKEHGKVDYVEAAMCTLFSTSIWFILDWLGLPTGAGVGIGVFISYIGTLRFSNWVRNKLNME